MRDPALLGALHLRWTDCALCDFLGVEALDWRLSLHHIHRHPRDDVQANLMMLCGSGTTGHHGLVEANQLTILTALARLIRERRPDTFAYLSEKLGSAVAADAWLTRMASEKQP